MDNNQKAKRRENYKAFKAWLILHNDEFIDRVRVKLEVNFRDIRVFTKYFDRHLYAVLKPTRTENLRRIEIALWALPPTKKDAIFASVSTGNRQET